MGRPNSSRETKFSGANGDREIFIFPSIFFTRLKALFRMKVRLRGAQDL